MVIKRRGAAPDTNRPIDRVSQSQRSVPPRRRKSISLTGIFLVLLVFAALGVAGYMYLGNGADIPIWQSDSGPTGTVYEPYDLGEMASTVYSNPMKAEQLYKGQNVELIGYLFLIDRNGQYITILSDEPGSKTLRDYASGAAQPDDTLLSPNPDVGLEDTTPTGLAVCVVKNDQQRQAIMNMSVGDYVIVRGKITGIEGNGFYLDIDETERSHLYESYDIRTFCTMLENEPEASRRSYQDLYVELHGFLDAIGNDGTSMTLGADPYDFGEAAYVQCNIIDDTLIDQLAGVGHEIARAEAEGTLAVIDDIMGVGRGSPVTVYGQASISGQGFSVTVDRYRFS